MSGPVEPLPVALMVSVIYSDADVLVKARTALEEEFGEVAMSSEPFPFDRSDYYRDEMGESLERVWLCFRRTADPSLLPALKRSCHRIERDLSQEDGNRMVNIDPGYLDYGKLVLASFKEAPDKIYMGNGVWAHTCLRYGHGSFTAPDHSFPDFRDGRFNDFMMEARRSYRRMIRSAGERDL
ncbi:MAG: DUF4416 family protein [Candidatus Fermentibacteraceae bacterium]|nr:DUF4416 family protein [Candidatus Fermentibacteraceae bacterium]MBN2607910.1 DUF4416 family protein [Candidatus Fermentibacteraceae bacterium]